MSEPDYRSFANKPNGGSYLDKRELELRREWQEWKKNKKKIWYL